MQAYVLKKPGSPSDLKLELNHPRPIPKGDELLIRIHAAGMNPVGYKAMKPPLSWSQKYPAIPEYDLAGEVVGGKLDGTGYKVGDRVFGCISIEDAQKTGQGALAQYVSVLPTSLARLPDHTSYEEGATFAIGGVTAFFWVLEKGGLKKGAGQKVFVNGGSGGVGVWVVQIAKAYGATVVTTSSPSSQSMIDSLSPTSSIDYQFTPLVPYLKEHYSSDPFDIIFDTVGLGEIYHASPAFLKKDGIYLDVAGSPNQSSVMDIVRLVAGLVNKMCRPTWLGGTPRKYVFGPTAFTPKLHKYFLEASELLENRTVEGVVDQTFEWNDVQKAYERSMSGRAKGKIVVKVA